jgi:hypothetical protein
MTRRRVVVGWVAATILACICVNPYVRGDGNGYYAWLVSPVIDGDLDFTNQFARADPLFQTLIFNPDGTVRPEALTATGRVGNQWSVGPAVLWAPWFLVAHAGVVVARELGAVVPADGYSWPYLWMVSIGTVVYGMLALWWSAELATRLGYARGAVIAAAGVGLASSLPVYQVILPFHVHALAAVSVTAFVVYRHLGAPLTTAAQWGIWGVIAGVMVQVYQLNGVMLLVAVWTWIAWLRRSGLGPAIGGGAAFAAGGLLACLPQMIGKAIVYGSPLTTGYQDRFFWTEPRLWDTAFSTNHGWVLWTPVVALALAGLVSACRRDATLRPWAAAAAVFYVVVASYQNWHGQSSFGNRFLLSLTVLLVIGLAAFAQRALEAGTGRRRALMATLAGLALWNGGFIFQWGTNIIPNRGPVSFRDVASNQVRVVPRRIVEFGSRYFTDRRGAQGDVEGRDQEERRDYRVVR